MNRRTLLLGVAVCILGATAHAADWPQWRGPQRDGVSQEKGLLKSWPEKGPPLLWTFKDAGLGFSSFAIVDGVAYTMGTRGEDEIVVALSAEKGNELWSVKVGPIFTFQGNTWGDGPRGTPVVDGKHLYALGGQGELVCLDISAKGNVVWRKNLIGDLGGEMMTEWGYSESPLVDGNLLICTPGGEKGTLAALDKNTGAVVWQSKSQTNKAPYTSPMLATIQGVKQYVQTSYLGEKNGGVISGYDAKDGKVLWTETLAKKASYSIASTPLIVGDKVYVSEGNGYGCHYFKFGAGFKAKDAYSKSNQKVMKNNHGGVVLVDGHVYGFGEPGMWICQDLETGAELWSERSVIPGRSGSLTAAEGLLYLYSDEGEVGLVAANPKEFQLVKSFTIPEKSKYPATRATSRASKVWAHPVIANGRLYLRDSELVFCYDIRGK